MTDDTEPTKWTQEGVPHRHRCTRGTGPSSWCNALATWWRGPGDGTGRHLENSGGRCDKHVPADNPEPTKCQYCRRYIEPGQICDVESHAGDHVPCEATEPTDDAVQRARERVAEAVYMQVRNVVHLDASGPSRAKRGTRIVSDALLAYGKAQRRAERERIERAYDASLMCADLKKRGSIMRVALRTPEQSEGGGA